MARTTGTADVTQASCPLAQPVSHRPTGECHTHHIIPPCRLCAVLCRSTVYSVANVICDLRVEGRIRSYQSMV
jgi:hypothetical protein